MGRWRFANLSVPRAKLQAHRRTACRMSRLSASLPGRYWRTSERKSPEGVKRILEYSPRRQKWHSDKTSGPMQREPSVGCRSGFFKRPLSKAGRSCVCPMRARYPANRRIRISRVLSRNVKLLITYCGYCLGANVAIGQQNYFFFGPAALAASSAKEGGPCQKIVRRQQSGNSGKDIFRFIHHPLAFCKYALPWGEGELVGSKGPRRWQRKVQRAITEGLLGRFPGYGRIVAPTIGVLLQMLIFGIRPV